MGADDAGCEERSSCSPILSSMLSTEVLYYYCNLAPTAFCFLAGAAIAAARPRDCSDCDATCVRRFLSICGDLSHVQNPATHSQPIHRIPVTVPFVPHASSADYPREAKARLAHVTVLNMSRRMHVCTHTRMRGSAGDLCSQRARPSFRRVDNMHAISRRLCLHAWCCYELCSDSTASSLGVREWQASRSGG